MSDAAALDFDPDALRERYRAERDRRLRPEANAQYVEMAGDFRHYIDDPYVDPGFTRAPLTDETDIAVIGGGFGGLLAGARLRQQGMTSIRIIEKGGDFGGTWYWNRYPGAACDVESYVYLPLLEGDAECPLHRRAPGHRDEAGGGHVEPVHDARVGEHRLHPAGEAVGVGRAAAGHREQPGGLVEDDEGFILKDDPGRPGGRRIDRWRQCGHGEAG